MDITLVGVTLLSMGMAAALSIVVWRMLRDERQRSDARVAALAAMASRPASSRPSAAGLDLPIRQAPVAFAPSMFVEREVASPWGHRLVVMGCLALVLGSVVFLALSVTSRNGGRRDTPANVAAASRETTTPAAVGLELVSLRDARQTGSLTITGLVQNPRTGAPLSRVTVTAYAFDDKGSFLASGRALLDVLALAPGDESPFVVTVPVTDTVARYRIGFRGEDGHVIAHIDKRQQAAIAANW